MAARNTESAYFVGPTMTVADLNILSLYTAFEQPYLAPLTPACFHRLVRDLLNVQQ